GVSIAPSQACCQSVVPNQVYDPATQCCTPNGLQNRYPIADLGSCPERVANPGHVASSHICRSLHIPASFGLAHFSACCLAHDLCYDTCYSTVTGSGKSQADCDGEFQACLSAQCQQEYGGSRRLSAQCHHLARVYYEAALSAGGARAYAFLQERACECCGGD